MKMTLKMKTTPLIYDDPKRRPTQKLKRMPKYEEDHKNYDDLKDEDIKIMKTTTYRYTEILTF